MPNATPNYFRVIFSMVSPKGFIRTGQQLLIDATSEKEALELAEKKLTNLYKWHKITGALKA